MLKYIIAVFMGALLLAQTHPDQDTTPETEHNNLSSLYSIADYDTLGDPVQDLKLTVLRAEKEGKRILLEVGGDWCRWCHILDNFIHDHKSVAAGLGDNFIIMKVNYSMENKNEAFLKDYPEIPGYPHLFVLEKDGKFLHSQGTAVLEKDASYSEDAILSFVKKWSL